VGGGVDAVEDVAGRGGRREEWGVVKIGGGKKFFLQTLSCSLLVCTRYYFSESEKFGDKIFKI
jgi:hypothetical protein